MTRLSPIPPYTGSLCSEEWLLHVAKMTLLTLPFNWKEQGLLPMKGNQLHKVLVGTLAQGSDPLERHMVNVPWVEGGGTVVLWANGDGH